ncbi:MAG: histidinol-phosphate transaminase [Planctomycetes bacterium]|nr:histidinol-phosphate transaminase [Planctomycetota bacterium]
MSYFRPNIEAMQGYQPGEQPREQGFIKLNTNENPYPPSPRVLDALRAALTEDLRKYPDPLSQGVREKAAEVYGLRPDQVIVGNGSDDLLAMVCRASAGEGDLIVQPRPTYTLYETLARIQGARLLSVPFEDFARLPNGLVQKGAKVTFVSNPNSPTGTVVTTESLSELADRVDGILVVDEAYVDFADFHSLSLLDRHDNVLVLRSFSKSFSLAGLRIGLGFGYPALIDGLLKVKDSYNLTRLSQAAALAALGDLNYMREMVARVRATREDLSVSLARLGLEVYASQSNFLWARCLRPPARRVYEELKRRKILIRYFNHPGLQDCLRITVGTPEEIEALVRELRSILEEAAMS